MEEILFGGLHKEKKFSISVCEGVYVRRALALFANPHTFGLSTYFPEMSSAPPAPGLEVFLCFQDHQGLFLESHPHPEGSSLRRNLQNKVQFFCLLFGPS